MSAQKVFFTGLPYNHHTLPGWGWPPERVKTGLENAVGMLLKEGYVVTTNVREGDSWKISMYYWTYK